MIGTTWCATRGGRDTPYNGLYGKAPPKRDMTGLTGVVNMAVKRVNPWCFMYSI